MSTFKNFVQCRVTTPITAVEDSIGLYDAVPPYTLPSEEGGLLVLTDSPTKPSKLEVISYTSRSALGLYGVTRGLEGTIALEWTGPVYCYQSLLAGEFKDLLDSKVAKVVGKQLSDENYTLTDKQKLEGIASEATKNRADSENADKVHTHPVEQVSGLGYAATAPTIGDGVEVLRTGAGGWMGQGSLITTPLGYPASIEDVTNQTKVIRSDTEDNGVTKYATGIHFAAADTWGRLRVDIQSPQAWVQGGYAPTGIGWTAELYHSANLLNIGTTPASAHSALELGTAATANLTTSNTDGTVGRVLKVGDGGWMGQGGYIPTAVGYPSSINDATNQTKVFRSDVVDNDVAGYSAGIHFAANDTWGRLRVRHGAPQVWVQGGRSSTSTGWTAELYHSGNLLNIGTTPDSARSALRLGTSATKNVGTAIGDVMEVNRGTVWSGDGRINNGINGFYSNSGNGTNRPSGFIYGGIIQTGYVVDGYETTLFLGLFGTITYRYFINGAQQPDVEVLTSKNILNSTGQSTSYPMSQKATTDAIANIPSVPKSAYYVTTLTDRGKSIDTSATVEIAASIYSVGDVIVVTNVSASYINIASAAVVTLRLAGSASTGPRILEGYGVATFRMVSNNVWFGSGAGLS